MIISLTGFMGSGKSRTGMELKRLLSPAPFVDLDREIVRSQGCSIPEIFSYGGEKAFREIETEILKEVIKRLEGERVAILSLGGGTITTPEAMQIVLSQTRSVFLRTRLETILERVGSRARDKRPLFADAEALFEKRQSLYAEAEFTVDTDGLTPREVAMKIIELTGVYL